MARLAAEVRQTEHGKPINIGVQTWELSCRTSKKEASRQLGGLFLFLFYLNAGK
jgi:hypothetical protein